MRVDTRPAHEPVRIDLYDGAHVMSLPASAPAVYAARARAEALLVELAEGSEAITKAGGVVSGVPDLSDPIEKEGVYQALFSLSLAELLMTGWDGIADQDGKELDFRPEHIVHLMRNARASDRYIARVMKAYDEAVSEGNG
jgi:hypothetical protein